MRSPKRIATPVWAMMRFQNSSNASLLTAVNFIWPTSGRSTGAVIATLLRGKWNTLPPRSGSCSIST